MLKPKRLEFHSIGPFKEQQVVSFDGLAGMVCVDGRNINTGGSSGSGKTTFLTLFDFLFNLNETPATQLQSRFSDEKISVAGVFDWNGKEVRIERGKNGHSVSIEGEESVNGRSDLAKELLAKIIGMPTDVFKKITHRRQKQPGYFLSMTNSEASAFLSDCLGLQHIEAIAENATTKSKEILNEINTLSSQLTGRELSLIEINTSLEALPELTKPDISLLPELKQTVATLESELQLIQEQEKFALEKLSAEKPNKANYQVLIEIPQERVDLEKRADDIKAQIVEKKQEKANKAKGLLDKISQMKLMYVDLQNKKLEKEKLTRNSDLLQKEINAIVNNNCPTCKQNWDQSSDYKAKKINDLNTIKGQLSQYEGLEAAFLSLESKLNMVERLYHDELGKEVSSDLDLELKQVVSKISTIDSEIQKQKYESDARYQNAIIEWQERYRADSSGYVSKITEIKNQIGEANTQIAVLVNKFENYEKSKQQFESQKISLSNRVELIEKEIELLKSKILDSKTQYDLEVNIAKALGRDGYLNAIFEETLDLIGEEATNYLRRIPNCSNATISFKTTKTTASKNTKKEICAFVTMNGEEAPIKTLSGGERTGFDLAVDMAVIKIVEARTGNIPGWLILDESFDGLGHVEKEQVMELIKVFAEDKLVLVVDHASETKESFTKTITIEKNGSLSRVVME